MTRSLNIRKICMVLMDNYRQPVSRYMNILERPSTSLIQEKVKIDMLDHIRSIIEKCSKKITGTTPTPAAEDQFYMENERAPS